MLLFLLEPFLIYLYSCKDDTSEKINIDAELQNINITKIKNNEKVNIEGFSLWLCDDRQCLVLHDGVSLNLSPEGNVGFSYPSLSVIP